MSRVLAKQRGYEYSRHATSQFFSYVLYVCKFVVLPWFSLVILAIRHATSAVFTDDHHGYFVCGSLQFNVFYYTDMFP